MKFLYKTKTINSHWHGVFECSFCLSETEQHISNVKRGRILHCGCMSWKVKSNALPLEINGIKIIKELPSKNIANSIRRFALFQCPFCPNTWEQSISDGKKVIKNNCGCIKRIRKRKDIINNQKTCKIRYWNTAFYYYKNIYTEKQLRQLYKIWCGIKKRCYSEKCKKYNNYGGRGIKMSNEWKNSFYIFTKEMGIKPIGRYSVDRINNNGNYQKNNCRWADDKTQQNNKRTNISNEIDERPYGFILGTMRLKSASNDLIQLKALYLKGKRKINQLIQKQNDYRNATNVGH